jgi:endonuclease G, mitochondrial
MKNFFTTILAIFLLQTLSTCQQEIKTNDTLRQYKTRSASIVNLEIPATGSGDRIIHHTGYSLVYSEPHEQAEWVAYTLTKEETARLYDRTDKFVPDPAISTGSANNADYSNSGYDRGHLAPAADMGWSQAAMAESFYYSNMSPQDKSFNRGIWKKLEELVRSWATEYDAIEIVTGPVLTNGLKSIGPDKVSVPNYYYKVILDYEEPDIKGIGFILPNAGSTEPLQHFAVSIDSVEKITGIDFYPALPDEQEKMIEKTLCIECWWWGRIK